MIFFLLCQYMHMNFHARWAPNPPHRDTSSRAVNLDRGLTVWNTGYLPLGCACAPLSPDFAARDGGAEDRQGERRQVRAEGARCRWITRLAPA